MEGNTGFNGNDEFGRMNGENGMPEANVNDFSNTANFSSYNYGFSNSNDNYSASSNAVNNFDYGYTGENAAYNAENIAGEAANFANEVNNTAESFGGSFSEPAGSASFGNYGFDNNAAMNNNAFAQSPVQNTFGQDMYQNQNTFGQDPVQNTFGQDMYQNQAQSTFGQDPVQNTYEQDMYQNQAQSTFGQDPVQNTFGQSAGTESFGVNEEPTYSQNATESFGTTNDSFSYGGGVEQPKKSSGMGIASLVLGILSIVCCCTGCFGSLLGILAIIFGIIHLGKKKGAKGLGIAGIITGALGLIIGIIMTIYAVTSDGLTTILDDGDDYDYGYDYDDDDDDDDYDYDYDYNYGDDDDDDDYDYDFGFTSLDYYNNTYGQWLLKSGSGNACYTFNFDNSWGWYKDYNDLTDNYYAGKSFEILTGDEAFELCNIDDSERAEMDEDRFLGYKLYVDKYISNGEDKSSQYNGEKYFAIGIYMDDDLQGGKLINVNADEEYEVSKNYDYIDNSYSWDSDDDDDSDDIEYKTVDLYDGYAQINVPDTWIEYGEQVTDGGTNYYAYGSSSGLFEMYVTIQDAGDSWSSADDMFNFCDEDLRNLFGSENIKNVVTDANANPALYYCEAYNDENALHYYCTYNYFDGKNFTMVEFYCDEDTVNADKDYYSSYMQEIAESLWIWG